MEWLHKKKAIVALFICVLMMLFNLQPVVRAEGSNPSIIFTIFSPTLNATQYDDDLKVVITDPNSTYQISNVKAKVDGKETNLLFNETAYTDWGISRPGWVGDINLNGLKRGAKTLEVTVQDVNGNTSTNKLTFNYTKHPILTISAPQDLDFTKGVVNVNAEASDLAGENCTIKVFASYQGGVEDKIAEATNQLNTTVNLSKYNGKKVLLRFDVTNETGGTISEMKNVYVDNSSFLTERTHVDGVILDFKDNRVLYRTAKNEVIIKDLQTSNEQIVYSDPKNIVQNGYLTPYGAMVETGNSLYEYKNNLLAYLGENPGTSLKVNGHYAIWNVSNGLYLMNLDNDSITLVSKLAGGGNDVTPSGEVYYWTHPEWTKFSNVYKYFNGITSKLSTGGEVTNDNDIIFQHPLSNGNITVYQKNWSLILNKDGKEDMLAASIKGFTPEKDYLINHDYVAYTKPVNGVKQIFIWKDGVSKQLTYFGADSYIESLNANGDVIANTGNGSYIIKNNGSAKAKLYDLGLKNFWVDNELYGVIGGYIIKIDTNPVFVTGVALPKTKLELKTGGQYVLTAKTIPANATNQNVKWSSSNTNVATIDQTGKITAKNGGTAIITVTTEDGNKAASCTVVVKDVTPPGMPLVNVTVTDHSTAVTGTAEAGATVVVRNGSRTIGSSISDNGWYYVRIPKQKAKTKLTITAKDKAGNVSASQFITVVDKTAPSAPFVYPVSNQAKVVTGKTEARAIVTVSIGSKKYYTKADSKGYFKVSIARQKAGAKLKITAADKAGNVSAEKTVTVHHH